jgi:hypothetical protein
MNNKILIGADVLMAGILAWKYSSAPLQIPLLYSRPWGDPQLVDFWYILLLPILMHVFYFLNIFFSKTVFHSEGLFDQLFRVANIFIIIAFTGIFLKILFLVT